jgi:hypothetical protein
MSGEPISFVGMTAEIGGNRRCSICGGPTGRMFFTWKDRELCSDCYHTEMEPERPATKADVARLETKIDALSTALLEMAKAMISRGAL